MINFESIYEEALIRHDGEAAVESLLPVPCSASELRKKNNSYYLSVMSRRIFRAGLKHQMVDDKWPAFEKVFKSFNIDAVRLMSDEHLEKLMHDKRIIRHWGKIKAVRNNAQAMHELMKSNNSMGDYLANWNIAEITSLWTDLKQHFTQMGGKSGPYFLRMTGKDTFLLTEDVNKALIKWGAIDKNPSGKRAIDELQKIFNEWSEKCHRPLCQISMILALSID